MDGKAKKQDEKYNKFKKFEGKQYSGMKVGHSHKWYYDKGEWRERKISPEEWDIYYETIKRRAGKAPEGSGAPVGTEYNWLIVSHQRVDKLDANSYLTRLDGKKFKVAHKRASKDQWNITEKTQRKKVIQFLEQVIKDLKEADEKKYDLPYTVGNGERIYGLEHQTRTELYKMAAEKDIPNRSKMSREELLEAIKNNKDGNLKDGQEKKELSPLKLRTKTRDELYRMAREKSIRGRSEMKKDELLKALRKGMPQQGELV